ncbi:hypothetical protein KHS38_21925 [Mucilaginibacter sp. Bleaf8]|uniref:hypothetical protein n=1 Tax=Mucilaginibacter sp. Bleaf8 TaxID=2834430 RepID=UPI001BCAD778|nr:hypothetical protein [Mucilaginibacter sp. Bleaf8]MBS7567079.1 hypothetical protein [Mucilaginibacter sp. Bleaf8]
MAKKKAYSSLGLDSDIYNNPGLLKSDAMKRIEEEQAGQAPAPLEQAVTAAVNSADIKPALQQTEQVAPAELQSNPSAEPEIQENTPAEKKSNVRDIFTRGTMYDNNFSTMVLYHDVLEDLHELARVRDEEGKRYPVKYLASNIIRQYLKEHEEEIEAIKTAFRKKRG